MSSPTPASRLADLPVELLIRIATSLSISDLSRLSRTNSRILSVLEYEMFRQDALEADPHPATALFWAVAAAKCHIEYRLRVAEKSIKAGANVNAALDLQEIQDDGEYCPPPV